MDILVDSGKYPHKSGIDMLIKCRGLEAIRNMKQAALGLNLTIKRTHKQAFFGDMRSIARRALENRHALGPRLNQLHMLFAPTDLWMQHKILPELQA